MHAKQPAAAEHLLCNGVIMMHFNEERITSAPPPLPNLTAVVPPLLPDEAWRSFFFFLFLVKLPRHSLGADCLSAQCCRLNVFRQHPDSRTFAHFHPR